MSFMGDHPLFAHVIHRRDVEQSSVSRAFTGDRVWVCYTTSRLCILLNFEKKSLNFLIQKPSRFSHTGVRGGIFHLLLCFLLAKFGAGKNVSGLLKPLSFCLLLEKTKLRDISQTFSIKTVTQFQ